jgi:tRNA A37 N6-isopentenylltransferase MiaA
MSPEDQRNTLIVELAGRTKQPVSYYQSLDDVTLAGTGAVLVFLREARRRTDPQIKTMTDDDMRNTTIVEMGTQTGRGRELQGLSNMDLARLALGPEHSFIRGVLLAGKFRSQLELNTMSPEDQRNTLIVELAGRTRQPVSYYQSLDDAALAGTGAVLVFLREANRRTDQQIKTMTDDDMRNTTIVEMAAQSGFGRELQGLSNMDLALMALGRFP